MKCPYCGSEEIIKKGKYWRNKEIQRYQCKNCGKKFLEKYTRKVYTEEFKLEVCICAVKRGISEASRIYNVPVVTIIRWIKQLGAKLEKERPPLKKS
jgi:transposase-like protein